MDELSDTVVLCCRMASTIIQVYLKQVLESFFHLQSQVRMCALEVVVLILRQGLVHPVQVLLYVTCTVADRSLLLWNEALTVEHVVLNNLNEYWRSLCSIETAAHCDFNYARPSTDRVIFHVHRTHSVTGALLLSGHVSGTASWHTCVTRTLPATVSGMNSKCTGFRVAIGVQCDIVLNCL